MLDKVLERLGLTRLKYYNDLKDEQTKTLRQLKKVTDQLSEATIRIYNLEYIHDAADFEGKARYASPDGRKVLKDLQRALNYLRYYQRAMWLLCAPDNDYYMVKELLEAWGVEPDEVVDDTYAKSIPGVPRRDRTGQPYDQYGVLLEPGGKG